jgi:hypothetical protein
MDSDTDTEKNMVPSENPIAKFQNLYDIVGASQDGPGASSVSAYYHDEDNPGLPAGRPHF